MNPAPDELNVLKFVQEIYRSVLCLQQAQNSPDGTCPKEIISESSYAILYSFGRAYKDIIQEHDRHVSTVISALLLNPKCDYYIEKIGEYLFLNAKFTWHHFRVFLSYTIALAVFAYKKGAIFLSDDLLFATVSFIENHFKEVILNSGGWNVFQQDCVFYTAEDEKERKLEKSNRQSVKNTRKNISLSNVLLVKEPVYTTFFNHTFGFSYTACEIQAYDLDQIYANCDNDYTKLVMFSLLGRDEGNHDEACILCGAAPSTYKNLKMQNILPKKNCYIGAHTMIVSLWVLNEMKYNCPLLNLQNISVM